MTKNWLEKLRDYPALCFTNVELELLLDASDNSRYSKVKRALARGDLIRIRRGLYCKGKSLEKYHKPNMFSLAQRVYGPSYISLESAMSYHGLIPEAVYTTTSVTTKRAKQFKTPLGDFSYMKVPEFNFFIGVKRIVVDQDVFLMAQPWKAICDYVFCYKKNWSSIDPLIESLRIEEEDLPELSQKQKSKLIEYYGSNRVTKFLQGVLL